MTGSQFCGAVIYPFCTPSRPAQDHTYLPSDATSFPEGSWQSTDLMSHLSQVSQLRMHDTVTFIPSWQWCLDEHRDSL